VSKVKRLWASLHLPIKIERERMRMYEDDDGCGEHWVALTVGLSMVFVILIFTLWFTLWLIDGFYHHN
jgi:hypothetical protein